MNWLSEIIDQHRERVREVECKNCKRIVLTWMGAPKCIICKCEMITVIKK